MKRREFLGLGAVAGGGLALGGAACSKDGAGAGDPSPSAADGAVGRDAPACLPTRADALGPFFEDGAPMRTQIAAPGEPGDRLRLLGQVVADDCTTPVAGVLIDVWQADREGNYHDAGTEYRLRGQVLTDTEGRFAVDTIRPGSYENGPGAWRPAHVHFMLAKPGFQTVATQLYFAGDPYLSPNDGCPSCGSDDGERIIELVPVDGAALWTGDWRVVLARG